jgi:hypothetical protein
MALTEGCSLALSLIGDTLSAVDEDNVIGIDRRTGETRLSFLRVLDKESKIADLPTVFLEAVAKSIGKSGWPPIATVTGRPSRPRKLDGRIKFETGQIAKLDPNRPVLWERVRRGQDGIVSGRGTDVEAPGSRVGLAELERTPAQNDTVFSLHDTYSLSMETQCKSRCWISAHDRPLVTVAALPLHLGLLEVRERMQRSPLASRDELLPRSRCH